MIEISGMVFLFPIAGERGKDCYGNGSHFIDGKLVNCACEYCTFYECCNSLEPTDCGKCAKDCFRKSLISLR